MQISKDVLETVIASITPSLDHRELVATLRARCGLDTLRYATFRDGFFRVVEQSQVLTEDGSPLGTFQEWAQEALKACDQRHGEVWDRHKGGPLRIVESEIAYIYLTAGFGDAPEAFYQFEIQLERQFVARRLFGAHCWRRPASLADLASAAREGESVARSPFGQPRYRLEAIHKIDDVVSAHVEADRQTKARAEKLRLVVLDKHGGETGKSVGYFDEFPELRTLPPRGRRLMDDWAASSAGRSGAVFCEHWVLTAIYDHTDSKGHRSVSFVPAWTCRKKLPTIKFKRGESIFGLWDRLLAFDKKAGHPFAWYFYMLHGNRLGDWVGRRVLEGAEAGDIVLPEHDYRVLQGFVKHEYGF